MSKLQSDYRRRSESARPPGGYRNEPSAPAGASESQLRLIRELQARCGVKILTDGEARALSVSEASGMITDLKADVPPPDPEKCPPKWDNDIWRLAGVFEDYARADGIVLRVNRPLVYVEIDDLVTRYRVREQAADGGYPQEVYGCDRRSLAGDLAARCWLHWPPDAPSEQSARSLTWAEVVEIIMAELWSHALDEHALDHFRRHFREYGQRAMTHWRSLRAIKSIDARPRVRPPAMRRKIPGATMADVSKEG